MRSANIRSAVIAAAVGCFTFGAFAEDPIRPANTDPANPTINDTKPVLPQGVTPKQLNDQQDVRAVIAAATNAGMTKGGFDDMIERLSSADRKRIGDFAKQDFTELDGRIEQISKNWQQKYGQTFDLNNDKLFEGFVTVYEGEITEAAAARTHWPVPVRVSRDVAANTETTVDYLENGRNVAIVTVPTSHKMPALTISMIHEPVDDWRIDIPDNITGQQIHDNVKTALTKLGDNVAAWPADVNEAYRAVGHKLLMAMYDVAPTPDNKSADADK